ncbi:DUF6527 family protein [Paracoccus marcusii]|uniref:DUF6527 family protein n=1 Tax=Paracoccus marcusii TaxID=59779 RepID=A0ABY7UPS6_9RHOB|nr:DUF6527 family protein [Paracoccus marcusii]WDA11684.1 DUF6527 family protein [Paracoccus marcusii]
MIVAQIGKKLRSLQNGMVGFMCPGCNGMHAITVEGPNSWGFNGNVDAPTFTPSILVRCGSAVDPSFIDEPGDPPTVCHSFVSDGQIQFLADCTHQLAGQTVPLPGFGVVE